MASAQEDAEKLRGEVRVLTEQLECAKHEADEHRVVAKSAQAECTAKVRMLTHCCLLHRSANAARSLQVGVLGTHRWAT